ncbi:MAG TPA: 6-pyruvoyl-tetrahydropterin synthase-related protein, partial [Pyrinomonadaceae bacterium]|nr:6-pyruvoyl-tetrahydropterin synthase-related protein [Pyrinomonadaceae bacterium]
GGFGDPGIRFYPPALYYLLAATRILTGSWFSGILLGFILLSVLGATGAFFWARCFLPQHLAIVAGVLYAFIPYRINEFYNASLLAEYAAASVLPFAFAFVVRVCRNQHLRDVVGLAVSFALLVLLNLPVAVIGSLSLLFYGLASIDKKNGWRSVTALSIAVLAGLAASAFYWTTMIAELPWLKNSAVVPNEALTSYFDYRRNFIFSPFSLGNINSSLANTMALATLSMAIAPLIMFCSSYRKKLVGGEKAVFAVFVFSLFMTTDLSRPLWAVIPKLREVQFPWRWFVVASCALPVLTSASIPFWKEKMRGKFRWAAIIALGGVLVALTYSAARMRDANYLARLEFDSASNAVFTENNLDYWLPVWVNARPPLMANEVEAKDRPITINSWGPELRTFSVGPGPAQEVRVRTFYYPNWIAKASGRILNTRPAYDGVLLVSVPSEVTSVRLEFQEPGRTRIAMILTTATWVLLLLCLVYSYIYQRGSRS